MEFEIIYQRFHDVSAVSMEIEATADDCFSKDVIDVEKTLNRHQQRECDDAVLEKWSERSRDLTFSKHCARNISELVLSGRDCDEIEVRKSTNHDLSIFHEFISAIFLRSVARWVVNVCLTETEIRNHARLEFGSKISHDHASSEERVFRNVVRLKVDDIEIGQFALFRVFTFLLTPPLVE